MTKKTIFLNPSRKLVDETVDWLCGTGSYPSNLRLEPPAGGVRSLAHVLVVVPTAQSERNLRFALARKAAECGWGGILPPKITMPNMLLESPGIRTATEAEELAAMAGVLLDCDISGLKDLFPRTPEERTVDWALDLAGVLLGVKNLLGEAALSISDVKCETDAARWRDLSHIERLFEKDLESKGIVPRSVARRNAADAGYREEGIEKIVLPSAVDINNAFVSYLENSGVEVDILIHANEDESAKFDEWGRPVDVFKAAIDPATIDSAPTSVVEADDIAGFFRAVEPADAMSALAVCDPEMYPALEGAFQNHFSEDELVLRNPSREKLAVSSLGRLLEGIVRLQMDGGYETFSALARTGDVARWARWRLGVGADKVATFIAALDKVQNAHLPRTLDDAIEGAQAQYDAALREADRCAFAGLKRLAESIKEEIGDPFGFLKNIFSTVVLDEKNPADRELAAAAKAIRELREACGSEAIPHGFRNRIFMRLLKSAQYMLEPTAENVLPALGWLEVPWCPDEELVIAGFNEGCVPENVVGHPFVPDSLRGQLGLSTNSGREMRDSFILAQAVRCRRAGAVRIHMHQLSGDKNVMKPSRILFNGIGDDVFPDLALRLYAVTKGSEGAPPKELPPAWRLKLPLPPEGTVYRESISTSALERYQKNPFGFFLSETFGKRSDDRRQELDFMAFGNLCHAALDRFAKEGPKDSVDSGEIAAFLEKEVRRSLETYGAELPAVVELQGETAIERLKTFAVHQAARRRAGWRIAHSERSFSCRIKDCPTLLKGKVDRIDEHEETGELAIIDYKTWDSAKKEYYEGVQLPVYRAMVEASGLFDAAKARSAKAFYCILAAHPEDFAFDEEHACHEGTQSEDEKKILDVLNRLAKGLFEPPVRLDDLEKEGSDYANIVWESAEKGIDPEWLADQRARKESLS